MSNATLDYELFNKSLSASFKSSSIDINNVTNCSIQIYATTTNSTGQFAIEATNEPFPLDSDYDTLSFSPAITPLAGANAIFSIIVSGLPFKTIRVSFAQSGGTGGSARARVFGK